MSDRDKIHPVVEAAARAIAKERESTAWDDIPDDRWEQRQCIDGRGAYRDVNANSKDDYRAEAIAALQAFEPLLAQAWRDAKDCCTCGSCERKSAESARRIITSLTKDQHNG